MSNVHALSIKLDQSYDAFELQFASLFPERRVAQSYGILHDFCSRVIDIRWTPAFVPTLVKLHQIFPFVTTLFPDVFPNWSEIFLDNVAAFQEGISLFLPFNVSF